MSSDPSERTIYVKNLDDRVDKETLEELFVQVGSVVSVFIKEHATPERTQQQNGQPAAKYAFVEFQDEESVLFSIEMLNEVTLFGRQLMISPRDKTQKADQFRFLQQKRNSNNSMVQTHHSSSYIDQVGANSGHRNHPYNGNNGKRYVSSEELHSYNERNATANQAQQSFAQSVGLDAATESLPGPQFLFVKKKQQGFKL